MTFVCSRWDHCSPMEHPQMTGVCNRCCVWSRPTLDQTSSFNSATTTAAFNNTTGCVLPCHFVLYKFVPKPFHIHNSDGNKTQMLRPRPRPIRQQQEHITEKTLLLQAATACFYQKITWYKNVVKKVMTSNIWHYFCSHCTLEHRSLLYFSIIMSRSVLSVLEARP